MKKKGSQISKDKVPSISIEEALRTYMLAAFPQGIPEGMDEAVLIKRLKAMIGRDRPEWAHAFGDDPEKNAGFSRSYAKIKQEILEKAQKEDIPTDKEERYFYERRKEARLNRLIKISESKEEEKKEKLIQKIIDQKKEAQSEEAKKIELVKKLLEEKLQKSLALDQLKQDPQPSKSGYSLKLKPKAPTMESVSNETLSLSDEKLSTGFTEQSGANQPKETENSDLLTSDPIFDQMELTEREKVKFLALKKYNDARKASWHDRADVIKKPKLQKVGTPKDKLLFSERKIPKKKSSLETGRERRMTLTERISSNQSVVVDTTDRKDTGSIRLSHVTENEDWGKHAMDTDTSAKPKSAKDHDQSSLSNQSGDIGFNQDAEVLEIKNRRSKPRIDDNSSFSRNQPEDLKFRKDEALEIKSDRSKLPYDLQMSVETNRSASDKTLSMEL